MESPILRRQSETMPLFDVLHKYPHDYKVVIVGDASMAPYEITHPGGSGGALETRKPARSGSNASWIPTPTSSG